MPMTDPFLSSAYQEMGTLNEEHAVSVVQNRRTKKLYVKKELSNYNLEVLTSLQADPVPGLPQIMELVEEGDHLVVIEELIAGETLQEHLDRGQRFTEEETVSIVRQLCRILTALHSRTPAIIHRDIKPANIMLSADNVVKLIDLDAAKPERAGQEKDTVLLGTVGYAAPEQYGTGASTVQTDLYAVGVLMNEMLSGMLPSTGLAESWLTPVIRTCLAVDPQERFSSAEELTEAMLLLRGQQTNVSESWRSTLPPGFRTGSVSNMIVAVLGYLFTFWICLTLEMEGMANQFDLWLNRITLLGVALGTILFSCNYLGIQERCPLTRGKRTVARVLGALAVDAAIVLAGLLALVIVEDVLFGI